MLRHLVDLLSQNAGLADLWTCMSQCTATVLKLVGNELTPAKIDNFTDH